MSKLDIGVVSRFFPPSLGGAQTHIYELASRLNRRGYSVSGLTTDSPQGSLDNQINITRMSNPNNLIKIKEFVHSKDIVHIHSLSGLLSYYTSLFCKLKSIPCIVTMHGGGVVDRPDYPVWNRMLHRWTRKSVLNNVDTVISTSEIFGRMASDYITSDKIVYIPNGVDTEFYSPVSKGGHTHPKPYTNHENVILSVNMIKEVKGNQYVIDALPTIVEEFPDICYIMIGSGEFESHIKNRAKELGVYDNIRLLGSIDDSKEILQHLRTADVFVIPSSGESTSIATLEALSTECPVVASPAGDLIKLVGNNERGRIAEIFSPGSYNRSPPNQLPDDSISILADEILWVLNNRDQAENLAKKGRGFVLENHSWPVIIEKIELEYNKTHNEKQKNN